MPHAARFCDCGHVIDTLVCPAVDGGERAVMYDRIRGVLDESVGEGTHFRVPWLQQPNVMDVRTRPRTISSVTGTKGEEKPPLPCHTLEIQHSARCMPAPRDGDMPGLCSHGSACCILPRCQICVMPKWELAC